MEYTINVGNHTRNTYKGTPEEIATLIYYEENGIDIDAEYLDKKELIYDQDEAVEFIDKAMAADYPHLETMSAGDIRLILDYEEEYMRSKGIIED